MSDITTDVQRSISTVNPTLTQGLRSGSLLQVDRELDEAQEKASRTIAQRLGTQAVEMPESPQVLEGLNTVAGLVNNPVQTRQALEQKAAAEAEEAGVNALAITPEQWLNEFESTIAPYVNLTDNEKDYLSRMSKNYTSLGMDPREFAEDFLTANAISNATGLSRMTLVENADAISEYLLGIPAQRNMTWARNIINSWSQGWRMQELSSLKDEYRDLFAQGYTSNDPIVQEKLLQIKRLEAEIQYNTDATPHNWVVNAVSNTVENIPYMLKGSVGGLIGGGIGFAIGGPVGATIGNYLGRFITYWGSFQGDSFYNMLDSGVSVETALKMSNVDAFFNATNEALLDTVSDVLLGTLSAGKIKTFLYPTAFKKIVRNGNVATYLGQLGLYLVGQGTGEFVQEATQSITSSALVAISETMDNIPHTKSVKEAIDDALEEGIAGFSVGFIMGIGGGVAATRADIRTATDLFDRATLTDSREAFASNSANMDAVKGMKLAGEHFSDSDARSQLNQLWDNAAEARVNRMKARAEVAGGNAESSEARKYTKLQLDPERVQYTGRLRSEARVTVTDDAQGAMDIEAVYGGITPNRADGYAPYYGTVRMEVNNTARTATIRSVHIAQGLEATAQEIVRQTIEDYAPGYSVSWETDVPMESAIREGLIRNNPEGAQAGLRYTPNRNTAQDRSIASYADRVQEAFPRLSRPEAMISSQVLHTLAERHGMGIEEFERRYAGGDFFISGSSDVAATVDAVGSRGAFRSLSAEDIASGVKGVIYAGKYADVSTFNHEVFHFAASLDSEGRADLSQAIKRMANENEAKLREFISQNANIFAGKDLDEVMSLYKALSDDGTWDTQTNEAITSLYEAWLANPNTSNLDSEVKSLLKKIASFVRQIYQIVSGNVQLDEDVQRGFEQIMGFVPSSPISEAREDVRESSILMQTSFPEDYRDGRTYLRMTPEERLAYDMDRERFYRELKEWTESSADVLTFANTDETRISLVSRNMREDADEKPWSVSRFVKLNDEIVPSGHTTYETKYEAVKAVVDENLRLDENLLFQNGRAEDTQAYRNTEAELRAQSNLFDSEGRHLAPNGEPSNLSYRNWVLVRTPAFKAWFGDWENSPENASKIVDENGEPLVVYHGTHEDFSVFDRTRSRANMDIQGNFFSPWREDSMGYGPNVRAFFLNMRNPADFNEAYEAFDTFKGQDEAGIKAREFLESKGYDGANMDGEEYIAFESNQIKSVDNLGTFDSNNPNVLFQSQTINPNIEEEINSLSESDIGTPNATIRFAEDTPYVFRRAGLPNLPMEAFRNKLARALFLEDPNEHGHRSSVSKDIMVEVANNIADPLFIFNSTNGRATDFVAVYSVFDKNGNPVIVSLRAQQSPNFIDINLITSIYGKEGRSFIENWTEQGLLRYADDIKLTGEALPNWLQLPAVVTSPATNNLLLKSDIVKSENSISRPDGSGDILYQLSPEFVRNNLDYETRIPSNEEFLAAIENTEGAQIVEDGIIVNLERYQKPEQDSSLSVRTGVFYLPAGASQLRYYRGNTNTSLYGGSVRFRGETLLKAPLAVKGATGGSVPLKAYEVLKGKEAATELSRRCESLMRIAKRGDRFTAALEIYNDYVDEYGSENVSFVDIEGNSREGNQLRYALQENIIAHAVREAGYDSVVGYNRGKLTEIFDVREGNYPSELNADPWEYFEPDSVEGLLFQDELKGRISGYFTRDAQERMESTSDLNALSSEDARVEGEAAAASIAIDESMSASSSYMASLTKESEIKPWDENSWWIDENGEIIGSEDEYNAYIKRYVMPKIRGRLLSLFTHREEQTIGDFINEMKPALNLTGKSDSTLDAQFLEALKDEETFRRIFGALGEIYYLNTTSTNAQYVQTYKKINGKNRQTNEVQVSPYIDQSERETLQRQLEKRLDSPTVASVMKQALTNKEFSSASGSVKTRAMKEISANVRLYRNLIADFLDMPELKPANLTDRTSALLPARAELDAMSISEARALIVNSDIDSILESAENQAIDNTGYQEVANVALTLKARLDEATATLDSLRSEGADLTQALADRDNALALIERNVGYLGNMLGIRNDSEAGTRQARILNTIANLNSEAQYQENATSTGARERGKAIGARIGSRQYLSDMASLYPNLKPVEYTSARDYEQQLRANIEAFRNELEIEYKTLVPTNLAYLSSQLVSEASKAFNELKTVKGEISKLFISTLETAELAKNSKVNTEASPETSPIVETSGLADNEPTQSTEGSTATAEAEEAPIDETLGIPRLSGSDDTKDTQLVEALRNDDTLRSVMKRYGEYVVSLADRDPDNYADEATTSVRAWAEGTISDSDLEDFRADVEANPRTYRQRFSQAFDRSDFNVSPDFSDLPPIESPETTAGVDNRNFNSRSRREIAREADTDNATKQSFANGSETLQGSVEEQLKKIGEAIKEINATIKRDQKKIETRNEKISSLRKELADSNRKIRSLNNRLEKAATAEEESAAALRQQISDMEKVIHDLELQLGREERSAATEQRNLQAQIDRLKERQAEEKEYRKMREYKLRLARSLFRKWTKSVDFRTVAPLMQYIRQAIDPKFRADWARDPITGEGTVNVESLRELYRGITGGAINQITAEQLRERIGARMYDRISGEGAKPLNDWTITELEELNDRLNEVWSEGRTIQKVKNEAKKNRRLNFREDLLSSIKRSPKYDDSTILAGSSEEREGRKSATAKMHSFYYATKRMQELAYFLDGDDGSRGTAYQLLVENVRTMLDKEYVNKKRRMEPFEQAMDAFRERLKAMGVKDSAEDILYHNQYEVRFDEGTVQHYNLSALAYIYLSQYNDRARDAVAYGNLVQEREKGHRRAAGEDAVTDFGGLNAGTVTDEEIAELGDRRYRVALQRATEVLNETGAMPIVEVIRDDLWSRENAQRLFDYSLEVFNQPIALEDNYLFIHRQDAIGNTPRDSDRPFSMAAGKTLETIEKGFLEEKRVISPRNQTRAEMDLFNGWAASVEQQEHLLAGGELLSDIRSIFETNREVMDAMTRAYGPEMRTEIENYIAHVADPNYSDVKKDVSATLSFLRGSVATAYLAYKVSSIFVQLPTSLAPFAGSVKTGSLLKSFVNMLAHPSLTWDFITARSVRMERRTPTLILQDVKDEARKVGDSRRSRVLSRFNQLGMSGLEWVDKLTVGSGWLAKYYDVLDQQLKEGKSTSEAEAAAIKAADDLVYETQPVSDKTELARLFRSNNALLRIFLQFQQALNVVFNNITTDANQQWKQRNVQDEVVKRVVGRMLGYVGAGILLGAVQQGFDDDDDSFDKAGKVIYWGLSQGVEAVPVVGNIVSAVTSAVLTGEYDSYLMNDSLLPFAADLGSGVASLFTALNSEDGVDMERLQRAATNISYSLGIAVGLPVSAIKQYVRAVDEKSLWPLLGRY